MDITWLLGEVISRHVPICVTFTVTWHKPCVSCVQISHSREELKEKEPESKHSLSLNIAPSVHKYALVGTPPSASEPSVDPISSVTCDAVQ